MGLSISDCRFQISDLLDRGLCFCVLVGKSLLQNSEVCDHDVCRNEKRTKQFALRVVRLVAALPRNREGDVFGRQVLKSGTSIGANYREALRASSKRQFVSILEIALREADETLYWLELIAEAGIVNPSRLSDLQRECGELVAILARTVKTAKRRPRK